MNVLRDPTHVMKLQTVQILMVHLNANAKRMAFLGMGKHAQVHLYEVFKCLNLFSDWNFNKIHAPKMNYLY